MPVDDIAEVMLDYAARPLVEYGSRFLFSGTGGRYFHGIGRRFIAVVTFGKKRIPSSLRIVPKGTKPKPRRSDWIALFVGITVWLAAAGATSAAIFLG